MTPRPLRVVLPLAAALLLAGCGAGAAERSPSTEPSASIATQAGGGADDSAPHELENARYRDRMPIRAESVPALVTARERVLRGLASAAAVPSIAGVRAVLAAAGAADDGWVAADAATGEVVFEAQIAQAGCLVGRVPADGAAAVDPAGFILDGGCHALTGH